MPQFHSMNLNGEKITVGLSRYKLVGHSLVNFDFFDLLKTYTIIFKIYQFKISSFTSQWDHIWLIPVQVTKLPSLAPQCRQTTVVISLCTLMTLYVDLCGQGVERVPRSARAVLNQFQNLSSAGGIPLVFCPP